MDFKINKDNAISVLESLLKSLMNKTLDSNMDAGAGSGVIGRFSDLKGNSTGGKQAYSDALKLTGVPVNIEIIEISLPTKIPMRYNLATHQIEVNNTQKIDRATAAQYMAEELLHSIDHLGNHHTLSAGSRRLDFLRGDILFEIQKHYYDNGYYAEFFDYPLDADFYSFSQDRIKAELFARLGVLYFAEPDRLKIELPLAHGVFHECFNLSRNSPVSTEYIRGKIWRSNLRLDVETRSNKGNIPTAQTGNVKSDRTKQANNGLEQLRDLLAKFLDSPAGGKKGKF